MASTDDPIPFWRRLAGTLVALLSVLGVLATVIAIVAWVATSRFSAMMESANPTTQPSTLPSPVTVLASRLNKPVADVSGPKPAIAVPAIIPPQLPPLVEVRKPIVDAQRGEAPRVDPPRLNDHVPDGQRIADGQRQPDGQRKPDGQRVPDGVRIPDAARPAVAEIPRGDQPKVEVITIDSPKGEYTVPTISMGRRVVLKGQVKTLTITAVTAGASLDTSELDVRDVKVRGLIDGGARVKIRADGKVKFGGPINGRSLVEINAAEGRVDFAYGISIDGGSRVTIAAQDVQFHGTVAGERTDVAITLSDGGSLKFQKLDGSVRMRYGKAKPADGKPEIAKGKILGQAQFGSFDAEE